MRIFNRNGKESQRPTPAATLVTTVRTKKVGVFPYIGELVGGEPDGAVGSMVVLVLVGAVVDLVCIFKMPAPPSMGRQYFNLACGLGGAIVGLWIGALFTPTTEAEQRRFSGLQTFVLGLGGAALIATFKEQLTASITLALEHSSFVGPDIAFVLSLALSATLAVTTRTPGADRVGNTVHSSPPRGGDNKRPNPGIETTSQAGALPIGNGADPLTSNSDKQPDPVTSPSIA